MAGGDSSLKAGHATSRHLGGGSGRLAFEGDDIATDGASDPPHGLGLAREGSVLADDSLGQG